MGRTYHGPPPELDLGPAQTDDNGTTDYRHYDVSWDVRCAAKSYHTKPEPYCRSLTFSKAPTGLGMLLDLHREDEQLQEMMTETHSLLGNPATMAGMGADADDMDVDCMMMEGLSCEDYRVVDYGNDVSVPCLDIELPLLPSSPAGSIGSLGRLGSCTPFMCDTPPNLMSPRPGVAATANRVHLAAGSVRGRSPMPLTPTWRFVVGESPAMEGKADSLWSPRGDTKRRRKFSLSSHSPLPFPQKGAQSPAAAAAAAAAGGSEPCSLGAGGTHTMCSVNLGNMSMGAAMTNGVSMPPTPPPPPPPLMRLPMQLKRMLSTGSVSSGASRRVSLPPTPTSTGPPTPTELIGFSLS
eukprot:GFYU01007146.1.p1 GENE.GFYU01007146.1~~GFYU01007146.1.p1  ORF type:complete len:352 (-),score=48.87 GFYU01007146.1:60-1115(-)